MTPSVHDRILRRHQHWESVHVVTRKLDLDQTSMTHTHTVRHKCDKLTCCNNIVLYSLDMTGWFWWYQRPKMAFKVSKEFSTASLYYHHILILLLIIHRHLVDDSDDSLGGSACRGYSSSSSDFRIFGLRTHILLLLLLLLLLLSFSFDSRTENTAAPRAVKACHVTIWADDTAHMSACYFNVSWAWTDGLNGRCDIQKSA